MKEFRLPFVFVFFILLMTLFVQMPESIRLSMIVAVVFVNQMFDILLRAHGYMRHANCIKLQSIIFARRRNLDDMVTFSTLITIILFRFRKSATADGSRNCTDFAQFI